MTTKFLLTNLQDLVYLLVKYTSQYAKSFRFRRSKPTPRFARFCPQSSPRNPFRNNTSKNPACNPFICNRFSKTGGGRLRVSFSCFPSFFPRNSRVTEHGPQITFLCFHHLTNPSFHNSFLFSSLQIPRGCPPGLLSFRGGSRGLVTGMSELKSPPQKAGATFQQKRRSEDRPLLGKPAYVD